MKILKFVIFFSFTLSFTNVHSVCKKEFSYKENSFLKLKEKLDTPGVKKEFKEIEKLFNQKNYPKSLERALNLLKFNIDNELRYRTTFLIAKIFENNNNHNKAILYVKKSLQILKEKDIYSDNKENNNKPYLIESYYYLGNGYLRLGQVDSARYYYRKILNFKDLNTESLSFKARASSTLSGIYMQDTLYNQAKSYAIEAISIHKKLNSKISESVALGNLASIYLSENNYDKAKEKYREALDLIKYEKSDRALRVREQLYFNLAYNLYKLKDYEAYIYQELSYEIKDTLRDKEIRKMIEELDSKYNFEAKKNFFQKQEENKRLKAQRSFWIAGIIGVIIIISLVYWLNIYNLKRKNLALELSQTELIQNQNLEKLKSESQVRILNATIDGKESERKQIAETLHDSVSALLSSANLHLQATRKQFNGSTPLEIHKTQEIILEASHKVRDLSHTLVSSVLLKFGLDFAIKDVAEKYSNSVLNIETEISNIGRYHQDFEIKVYNIIQEFINNILKHSKAENALIELKEESKMLFLVISDDGLGFDKTKINMKDGLGINQIDARIQMMKGKFLIESSFNNGTKISVELPVIEKEEINHV